MPETYQPLKLTCSLSAVSDGEHAVDFLLKRGQYSSAPTPDLIFLDVNLPKLSGIDVLRQVPNAHKLPICVVTSSESERQIFRREFGIQLPVAGLSRENERRGFRSWAPGKNVRGRNSLGKAGRCHQTAARTGERRRSRVITSSLSFAGTKSP
jgi:CheY-like chemotaxis protein